MNTNATRQQALELHRTIDRGFDRAGLRDLSFVLGIDDENLPGETKRDRARELVLLMERRGRLPELEQAVQQMVPRGRKARGPRNRRIMIEKVRRAWVQGVLERSLYHVARIELGLGEQPEAVERPWSMMVQEQDRAPRELPQGARMIQVFDELGGSLLLLGAPGTGKTTLLLELARDLLDRAARDPEHPIPAVFHLSSWALRQRPLDAWLADELNQRYDVPIKTARAWVEEDAILPLLDGLDEVAAEHRAACAEAINAWRREHGLVPVALCSRTEEFEALDVRLRLQGAVAIEPLTREQVDAALAGAGEPLDGVRGALDGVREALAGDETLYELLDTPLMLSVATMAYRAESASVLRAVGTLEERRERLFAAYVEAMHERRTVEPRYAREQTDRWLSWLAGQMRAHNQGVFLLERMRPDWLPDKAQGRLVVWGAALLSGLIAWLLVGLLYVRVLWQGGVPVVWLFGGPALGLAFALAFGLFGSSIQGAEALHWSWSRAGGEFARWLLFGLLGGLVGGLGRLAVAVLVRALIRASGCAAGPGLLALLALGAIGGWAGRWVGRRVDRPVAGLVVGLLFGLLGGLVGWLAGGVEGLGIVAPANEPGRWVRGLLNWLAWGGISGGILGLFAALGGGLAVGEMSRRRVPNQGLRRSARSALIGATVAGLIVVLAFSLGFGVAGGLSYPGRVGMPSGVEPPGWVIWLGFGLEVGLMAGLIVGLVAGLVKGGLACLQHLVLRYLLVRNDFAPWRVVPFLDYAAERIFLRKVGGGYIFVHRLLLEWFAETGKQDMRPRHTIP